MNAASDPEAPARNLRVLVADDDPLVRRTLVAALDAAPGMVVDGVVCDGEAAIAAVLENPPDVVVMDVDMPVVDGITATLRLRQASPSVRVLVIAPSDDVELALLSLRAGASGFLAKDVASAGLARAIVGVSRGEAAISRALVLRMFERVRRAPFHGTGMRPVHSDLTGREWHVLDLLCDGAEPDAIAGRLGVSPETVRTHVANVRAKLGADSVEEAVAIGRRQRSGDAGVDAQPPLDELALRRVLNLGLGARP